MEFVNEKVKLNQVVKDETVDTVFENDIIVPDVNPDIKKILLLDGDINVVDTQVLENKIKVNSRIDFKILYVSEEEEGGVKSINTSSGFNYSFNENGITPDMNVDVRCVMEHLDYSILNGRKVNIKCLIKISNKCTRALELDLLSDVREADNLQKLVRSTEVTSFIGINSAPARIEEVIEVPGGKPAISEILRHDLKIVNKEYELSENNVLVKGDVNISTLYIGDDETKSIQFMEHEIPVSCYLEIEGINKDSMCEMDINFQENNITVEEDSDGELRMLKIDVELRASAKGYENVNVNLINDVYSTKENVNIKMKEVSLDKIVNSEQEETIVKDNIEIENENPDILEVFNVQNKVNSFDYTISNEKVNVEGILDSNIIYLTENEENPIYSQMSQIPFKQSFDIKNIDERMSCDICINIENCSYTMLSARKIEIRISCRIKIKVMDKENHELIEDINITEFDQNEMNLEPNIIIYFTQKGDNLWKIAKKYHTTVEDIKYTNNISDNEDTKVGQKVFIPR